MKKIIKTSIISSFAILAIAANPLNFSNAAFAQDAEEAEAVPPPAPSPNQIVEQAAPGEWVAIAPSDLLVMDLAPDRDGNPRQVIIQLMPAPFGQGWIRNIRKLAAVKYWDGTSIIRVQDNYVTQWGDPDGDDAEKAKPLPENLEVVSESEYLQVKSVKIFATTELGVSEPDPLQTIIDPIIPTPDSIDHYAEAAGFWRGWPLGHASQSSGFAWPVHCYGMVGVGRNLSPNTGDGSSLYTVIGHAPRHLDRNIALVGRIIEGMEHMSSLPRGKGFLGFYEDPDKRIPITSVKLASSLPPEEQPALVYLDTEGTTFAKYADARANRRDPFFNIAAGGADVCNIPVPVKRVDTDGE